MASDERVNWLRRLFAEPSSAMAKVCVLHLVPLRSKEHAVFILEFMRVYNYAMPEHSSCSDAFRDVRLALAHVESLQHCDCITDPSVWAEPFDLDAALGVADVWVLAFPLPLTDPENWTKWAHYAYAVKEMGGLVIIRNDPRAVVHPHGAPCLVVDDSSLDVVATRRDTRASAAWWRPAPS